MLVLRIAFTLGRREYIYKQDKRSTSISKSSCILVGSSKKQKEDKKITSNRYSIHLVLYLGFVSCRLPFPSFASAVRSASEISRARGPCSRADLAAPAPAALFLAHLCFSLPIRHQLQRHSHPAGAARASPGAAALVQRGHISQTQ